MLSRKSRNHNEVHTKRAPLTDSLAKVGWIHHFSRSSMKGNIYREPPGNLEVPRFPGEVCPTKCGEVEKSDVFSEGDLGFEKAEPLP